MAAVFAATFALTGKMGTGMSARSSSAPLEPVPVFPAVFLPPRISVKLVKISGLKVFCGFFLTSQGIVEVLVGLGGEDFF